MADAFHRRGHHVQSAHGRRTALAAAPGEDHTQGCMIALMPTAADAKRLAVPGGEAASELHCTLMYLGGDASAFPSEAQQAIIAAIREYPGDQLVVTTKIFGIGHWNGGGDSPSWVWNVGDDPDAGAEDCPLDDFHTLAEMAVMDGLVGHQMRGGDPVPLPDPHSPWVAHICAAYTDDLTLAPVLEQRLGPVTFDRVRVSFGDRDTDIPLGPPSVTAAARPARTEFRRRLTAAETASRIDFAGHQADWDRTVTASLHDWSPIQADWRNQVYQQLLTAKTAADLASISVDTSDAAEALYTRLLAAAERSGRAQQRAAQQQGVKVGPWEIESGGLTAGLAGRALLRSLATVTADILGSALVQSAKTKALRLFATLQGTALASAVEQFLASLSSRTTRDNIGAAVTAAQAVGQRAVLNAAPPATSYTASEILDDNCCQPCQQVDGKVFSNLSDAEAAYPGGCYEDCLGGGRCRGQIVAVWGDGSTASAAQEGEMTTALGGKPSTGTDADRRLKENKGRKPKPVVANSGGAPCAECPDDAAHFGSSNTVSDAPWDGAASNFTDQQYKTASAACDPGNEPPKEACFLPHHDPSGELNRAGLAAAAGRFSGLKGHSPAAVAAAKSHLVAHYHAIKEPVPDNLAAALDGEAFDVSGQQCPDGWVQDPDGDGCVPAGWEPGNPLTCPAGMVKDPDGQGCIPATEANMAIAPTPIPSDTAPVAPSGGLNSDQTAPWNGVLAVEGVTTGDGREFAPDALTWRDLPVPLRWNRVDSHGGEPRTEAVNVGRIDTITRDGNQLKATGQFDLSTPDGQTAYNKVKGGFLRGVSIDADSISDAKVEFVWPEANNEGDDDSEPDLFAMLFAQPEKTIFHAGRISGATLCDIPAFAEAYVQLTDPETGAVTAGGAMALEDWQAAQEVELEEEQREAVTASLAGWEPPAEWFADPHLSLPTPITVDESGRVYGHAAQWGTCHIGQTGQCVKPPREDYHAYYLTGEVRADDGKAYSVGQITVGTGHAPLYADAHAATEHYDHTGWSVADVVVGNDPHGIWVAGAIRADADPSKVAALRAAGQVSGDWRRIGGKLRLVGLLAVNVPGFPVPRMKALQASGEPLALVAAGQPTVARPGAAYTDQELDQMAMQRVMAMLARRIKED